jgi:hypothetical protein
MFILIARSINNTLHEIDKVVAVCLVQNASINRELCRKVVVVRQIVHHHLNRNNIAVNVQDSSVHEPAAIAL